MKLRRLCLPFLAVLAFLPAAFAADDLARLPRPWQEPMHRLTLEEYEATLQYWAGKYPRLVTLQKRADSLEGMPIYLLKITDSSVPDTDKQVTMVSALHGGPERTGATTILHLAEWLMGDSETARETRRKQVLLLMPIINPYAFFVSDRFGNKHGVDLYDPPRKWWNLPAMTLAEPDKTPELATFLAVMDEYKPDMHFDLHGTGFQGYKPEELPEHRHQMKGVIMFEVSACSYSNCSVRPWDWRVTEAMVHAGVEAGYGSDRVEADGQRVLWNPDLDILKDRTWIAPRPDRFRTMFYSYMKYHTMISTTEIAWEQSGVARIVGILELGNKQWADESFSGYPVTRVKARAARYITAYGSNATERRDSRVELWPMQGQFVDGVFYPEYAGRTSYVVAVTPRGVAALDANKDEFIEKLRAMPEVNADGVARYLKEGIEIRLTGEHDKEPGDASRIQQGVGFRFRVPYRKAEMLEVAVNGHALKESPTDGYQAWYAGGYTQVQINVPPAKSREADLYVVTCAYHPHEERTYGFEPPAEVKTLLEKANP